MQHEKKCQRWIKLHAQVGTITNVIASAEATESTVGDSVMLAPLLASSVARGFNVRELSADKAYLSNENLTAVEAVGAVPYVPFKSNSRATGKSDAWRRCGTCSRLATTSSSRTTTSAVLTGAAIPPGTCKHCGRTNET